MTRNSAGPDADDATLADGGPDDINATLPPRGEDAAPAGHVKPDASDRPGAVDPIVGRTVLGNYRVERKIGSGAMGAVYLIRHTELPGTVAALKVLHSDRLTELARERFRQEALVASVLGGHRVVRPIDIGKFEDGIPYIAMEYIDGRSLLDELRAVGSLPLVSALQIAVRVADTMRVAHARGIVHRDLKPANIMLYHDEGHDYGVRLLDFGIARAAGALKVAHTREGTYMGTPGYMSPEAAAGVPVDGRADVFSLGVILFRAITGQSPFPATTASEAMAKVMSVEPAPSLASQMEPGAEPPPQKVEQLVARALTKHVTHRPTMEVIQAALVEALAEIQGKSGVPGSAPDVSAQRPLAATQPLEPVHALEPESTEAVRRKRSLLAHPAAIIVLLMIAAAAAALIFVKGM